MSDDEEEKESMQTDTDRMVQDIESSAPIPLISRKEAETNLPIPFAEKKGLDMTSMIKKKVRVDSAPDQS